MKDAIAGCNGLSAGSSEPILKRARAVMEWERARNVEKDK